MIRVTSIVVLAGLLAVVIRTLLFLTFSVTSGSMEPTLLVGDDFLLTKFSYGYSRYALPFSVPLFNGRILASSPQRGDVVVFRYPKDDRVDFVKRVVGLPGDRIQLIDDVLHINGEPVKRERVDRDIVDHDELGPIPPIKRWRETLPNGVTLTTNELIGRRTGPVTTPVYDVPAGHCFIIGDNRDNSRDSRDLSDIGYVPFENIIGRAQFIFLSLGSGASAWQVWRWPTAARFDRSFRLVH
jgi:signal peptidase I